MARQIILGGATGSGGSGVSDTHIWYRFASALPAVPTDPANQSWYNLDDLDAPTQTRASFSFTPGNTVSQTFSAEGSSFTLNQITYSATNIAIRFAGTITLPNELTFNDGTYSFKASAANRTVSGGNTTYTFTPSTYTQPTAARTITFTIVSTFGLNLYLVVETDNGFYERLTDYVINDLGVYTTFAQLPTSGVVDGASAYVTTSTGTLLAANRRRAGRYTRVAGAWVYDASGITASLTALNARLRLGDGVSTIIDSSHRISLRAKSVLTYTSTTALTSASRTWIPGDKALVDDRYLYIYTGTSTLTAATKALTDFTRIDLTPGMDDRIYRFSSSVLTDAPTGDNPTNWYNILDLPTPSTDTSITVTCEALVNTNLGFQHLDAGSVSVSTLTVDATDYTIRRIEFATTTTIVVRFDGTITLPTTVRLNSSTARSTRTIVDSDSQYTFTVPTYTLPALNATRVVTFQNVEISEWPLFESIRTEDGDWTPPSQLNLIEFDSQTGDSIGISLASGTYSLTQKTVTTGAALSNIIATVKNWKPGDIGLTTDGTRLYYYIGANRSSQAAVATDFQEIQLDSFPGEILFQYGTDSSVPSPPTRSSLGSWVPIDEVTPPLSNVATPVLVVGDIPTGGLGYDLAPVAIGSMTPNTFSLRGRTVTIEEYDYNFSTRVLVQLDVTSDDFSVIEDEFQVVDPHAGTLIFSEAVASAAGGSRLYTFTVPTYTQPTAGTTVNLTFQDSELTDSTVLYASFQNANNDWSPAVPLTNLPSYMPAYPTAPSNTQLRMLEQSTTGAFTFNSMQKPAAPSSTSDYVIEIDSSNNYVLDPLSVTRTATTFDLGNTRLPLATNDNAGIMNAESFKELEQLRLNSRPTDDNWRCVTDIRPLTVTLPNFQDGFIAFFSSSNNRRITTDATENRMWISARPEDPTQAAILPDKLTDYFGSHTDMQTNIENLFVTIRVWSERPNVDGAHYNSSSITLELSHANRQGTGNNIYYVFNVRRVAGTLDLENAIRGAGEALGDAVWLRLSFDNSRPDIGGYQRLEYVRDESSAEYTLNHNDEDTETYYRGCFRPDIPEIFFIRRITFDEDNNIIRRYARWSGVSDNYDFSTVRINKVADTNRINIQHSLINGGSLIDALTYTFVHSSTTYTFQGSSVNSDNAVLLTNITPTIPTTEAISSVPISVVQSVATQRELYLTVDEQNQTRTYETTLPFI